jgi:hypothetical protein
LPPFLCEQVGTNWERFKGTQKNKKSKRKKGLNVVYQSFKALFFVFCLAIFSLFSTGDGNRTCPKTTVKCGKYLIINYLMFLILSLLGDDVRFCVIFLVTEFVTFLSFITPLFSE